MVRPHQGFYLTAENICPSDIWAKPWTLFCSLLEVPFWKRCWWRAICKQNQSISFQTLDFIFGLKTSNPGLGNPMPLFWPLVNSLHRSDGRGAEFTCPHWAWQAMCANCGVMFRVSSGAFHSFRRSLSPHRGLFQVLFQAQWTPGHCFFYHVDIVNLYSHPSFIFGLTESQNQHRQSSAMCVWVRALSGFTFFPFLHFLTFFLVCGLRHVLGRRKDTLNPMNESKPTYIN